MQSLLARIDSEIAAGRRWRAKEIIRGNIAAAWPDAEIVERHGQNLLALGDQLEAGKFLFASGVRKREYEEAIALFLARYARSGPDNLVAQFPKSFRRQSFEDLPAAVRRELEKRGVKRRSFGARDTNPPPHQQRVTNALAIVATFILFASLVVGIGVGFRQIVLWISAWLTGERGPPHGSKSVRPVTPRTARGMRMSTRYGRQMY